MFRYLRFASLALCSMLVAGLSAFTAAPASASSVAPAGASSTTYLCWGYAGCARAGMGNAGYSAVGKTMYWRMYGGHNCTNYAAYRMVQSGLPNTRPWTGSGNATNWGSAMSRITDGQPSVGAIAWWRAYVSPAGSAGHVAYVERVVDANTIIVSQDSWGGEFSWKRITRGGGQWPSGFVHFGQLAQRNTAKPAVTGTPQAGQTLTATPGTWAVAGATYRYQWRAAGTDIVGATGSTLRLGAAQVGKAVSVAVTAVTTGYPSTTAVSAATATVRSSAVTNTTVPTISGTAAVGSTLAASAGSWSPAGTTTTFQWRSGGKPLTGQTRPTLTLTPELVGKPVRVAVTGHRTGYDDTTTWSPLSAATAPGTITLTTPPVVAGTPQPGQRLSLTNGTATPADTALVTHWLRDGVAVAGATRSTYPLTTADVGHQIAAQVTGQRAGYAPLAVTTAPTPRVRATPTVKVTAVPGHRTLKLTVAVTAPGADAVTGVIGVRLRGVLLGTMPVRAGKGTLTLSRLPVGSQSFRVHFRTSSTVLAATVWRRVTIR